jgi:hypothetical protein
MFFNNVGRRNKHVLEEVLPTCVDCQSKLLIGGGGTICEDACHFRNTHYPLAHSKPALKSRYFLGGIDGMCRHRTSRTTQRHMLTRMMSLVGCIRHLNVHKTRIMVKTQSVITGSTHKLKLDERENSRGKPFSSKGHTTMHLHHTSTSARKSSADRPPIAV